jgi:hypothetical protein
MKQKATQPHPIRMEWGVSAANLDSALGDVSAIFVVFDGIKENRIYSLDGIVELEVGGWSVQCALAYPPGDSGFESHFNREFSGGA